MLEIMNASYFYDKLTTQILPNPPGCYQSDYKDVATFISKSSSNLSKWLWNPEFEKDPLAIPLNQKIAFGVSLASLGYKMVCGDDSSLGRLLLASQVGLSLYQQIQSPTLSGVTSLVAPFTPLRPLAMGVSSLYMGWDICKQTAVSLSHLNRENYLTVGRNLLVYGVNGLTTGKNLFNTSKSLWPSSNAEELSQAKQLLNLDQTANPTPQEIKAAFRKASTKVHPDKGGNKEAFEALTQAKEVLLNTKSLVEKTSSLFSSFFSTLDSYLKFPGAEAVSLEEELYPLARLDPNCELRRAMGVPIGKHCPLSEQCFPLKTLEERYREPSQKAREHINQDELFLSQFGNKHLNLVKMARLVDFLDLPNLEVPLPFGVSSQEVEAFLRKVSPAIFTNWAKLATVDFKESEPLLQEIDKLLEKAFLTFPFSKEMEQWIADHQGKFLMVRSTGAEDSKGTANAGGNLSEAYVSPEAKSIAKALGNVVRSYFRKESLQNRINAGQNPFDEPLKFSVTMQELIGEPVGGAKHPSDIPVSFVLFTNEPLYINGEKFRAMRISATYGHGEAVVSNQGLGTDTALILRSESEPDKLYMLYDNQPKEMRLAPLKKENGKVSLGALQNPEELSKKKALSTSELIDIYTSGVAIESFFEGDATDIEGIVKNGKIYFVQARPVIRKAMLPTYLSKASPERMQAESLVIGKASAISIVNKEEILIASTLQEAEKQFDPSLHTLILVSQPEPENSHPVVNFSGLGIPCLYTSQAEELKKLVSKVDADHPLIVCMQTATVHLWNPSLGKVEDHIVEGFGVHPAKIALSLPSSGLTLHTPSFIHPEIKELLQTLTSASTQEEALTILLKLETHPSLLEIQKKIEQLEQSKGPSLSLGYLTLLKELHQEALFSLKEMRALLEKTPFEHRVQRLLQIKVVETLLIGGKGQLSLSDSEAIMNSITILNGYRGEALLDLVLKGKQGNDLAFTKWNAFLESLEPLIIDGKITQEEVKQFKTFIKNLEEIKALPFWLTFFQNPNQQENPLLQFQDILKKLTPSDLKLMDSLLSTQQELTKMHSLLERFASPETFDIAFNQLDGLVNTCLSPKFLDTLETSSPIIKVMQSEVLKSLIDLIDSAAKKTKSSHHFPGTTQVQRFKEILAPYQALMNILCDKLIPNNLKVEWGNTQEGYFAPISTILKDLPNDDLAQLNPSRDFSVAAAMIGSRALFERHNPRTLEDMLTLLHQNSLAALTVFIEKMLNPKVIKNSFLPNEVQEIQDQIEQVFAKNRKNIQKTGVEISDKEIVLKYNIPLFHHSALLEIHYDIHAKKITMDGKLLGEARIRWTNTLDWFSSLEKVSKELQNRPMQQGNLELSFSWKITKKNLQSALGVYIGALDYSLSNDELDLLKNRMQNDTESSMELLDILAENKKIEWLFELANLFYREGIPTSTLQNKIKILFENALISEQNLEEALLNAARTHPLQIVLLILKIGSISEQHLGKALIYSAEINHLNLLKLLLENAPISEWNRGEALSYAAAQGHLDIVKSLLENGSISEEHRGEAVNHATRTDHLDLVKFLLENGSISEEDRGRAVGFAAYKSHLDIVKLLLKNGPISEKDRGRSIKHTDRIDHLDLVKLLLENGSISEEDRGQAVISAAYKGHLDIVKLLLKNAPISKEARGEAVYNAARSDHLDLVKLLLENGPISKEDVSSIKTKSIENMSHNDPIIRKQGFDLWNLLTEKKLVSRFDPYYLTFCAFNMNQCIWG